MAFYHMDQDSKNSSRIDKYKLFNLVFQKLNIHRLHVFSVLNILIDELIKELRTGNSIKINNFGEFKLKSIKPKKIRNIATGQIKFIKTTKVLRFKLADKLVKLLGKK